MSFKKFVRSVNTEVRELEAFEVDKFHERGMLVFFEDSDTENKNPMAIKISLRDLALGSPKLGDRIVRDIENPKDQWLVSESDFKDTTKGLWIPQVIPERFDFGTALTFVKQGKKVARSGWNGSGMFIYYVPAAAYPPMTEVGKEIAEMGVENKVQYREYLALKTAQGDVATWAPSGSDSLAEDWMIVESTPAELVPKASNNVRTLTKEDIEKLQNITPVTNSEIKDEMRKEYLKKLGEPISVWGNKVGQTEGQKCEDDFTIGDVVMLKSGSPRMTVKSVNGTIIYSDWFIDQHLNCGQFDKGQLKKVPS